jgi:hypothetical protein
MFRHPRALQKILEKLLDMNSFGKTMSLKLKKGSTNTPDKKICRYHFPQIGQNFYKCITVSKLPLRVHMINSYRFNAPLRLSYLLLSVQFSFSKICHHSKSLKQYLIFSIPTHLVHFG